MRLRGAAGEIYTPDFTHARLSVAGAAIFEIHVGIKVRGVGATHECDVAVLHAGVGSVRRTDAETPVWSDTTFAIEVKADAATTIGLNLGRQAVGLASTPARYTMSAGSRS